MKIINVPRGSGKSEELIRLAAENNCSIVVSSAAKKDKILEKILYNKSRVPVYTVAEFLHGVNGAVFTKEDKICIDDMDEVLQEIIGFNIAYATCSIPYEESING